MTQLQPVKYKHLIWPLVIGGLLWLSAPLRPAGLNLLAWRMLALFVGTIIGCITQPLPIAGVALIGLTLGILLNVTPMSDAMAGFGNNTVWMIAMAYFLSRGFVKTGLGRRIALIFVKRFGRKTLGLAYALTGVDLVTSPATPSNTARAGGIVFPIIESLAKTYGSNPENGTQRKIGAFLIMSSFHGNIATSGLFMTAMAPNLVAVALAQAMGIQITWMGWLLAALVPGLICLIGVPAIIYRLYPPEIKDTPNARTWAEDELHQLGQMSTAEKRMAAIFSFALILWILASFIDLDATLVAFMAVGLLLLTGVLSVDDLLHETGAWNTLIWFSILIFMAGKLNSLGFIPWLSQMIGHALHGISWLWVLAALMIVYFYSHYLFAGATAHVSAMYGAFLGVAVSAGAPPLLAALLLGFDGAIFSSTTHYANGPASIMFGPGYVTQSEWWRLNLILGGFYLLIWGVGGTLWMKVLGYW
ncbi:DASS family sodium-coupled anion symporter [Lactiplantibacillus paraplantarum]|uniref:DASS family sodium-coupled anion symporter n=1 Tax=Lactiplantibacillus paraplantarum TaxID=60520 RepID=UPI003DA60B20